MNQVVGHIQTFHQQTHADNCHGDEATMNSLALIRNGIVHFW